MLIAFDGIDSSGKATQAKTLAGRLRSLGREVLELSSPNYDTPPGREIKERFQGKRGGWDPLTWQKKNALFAAARAATRYELTTALKSGSIVIYDRYVPSSLAFMTIEAARPQEVDRLRPKVHKHIKDLEYTQNQLPREDVSIFLDVPPRVAGALLEKRKRILDDKDEYTDHLQIMERLYNEYDVMCSQDPKRFMRVKVTEGTEMLSVAAVSELIWESLLSRFPELEKSGRVP